MGHPKTPLFHEYLLSACERTPDAPAIIGPQAQWSFAELTARVDDYATTLGAAGLGKGDFAVLDFYPCPEAIALMLACSQRGIAFVNVAADTPIERKRQVAARVGARLVCTQPGTGTGAPAADVVGNITPTSTLELVGSLDRPPSQGEPEIDCEDIAYLIFTSGTTGTPKGIMMSHRAVVSAWRGSARMNVQPSDRIGTMAPLQFDFALFDLGMALGNGAALVQVPALLLQQPRGFAAYLKEHGVTQMQGVPSLWRETLRARQEGLFADTALHSILYGAEAFPADALRQLCRGLPITRVINIFGPSESILCAFEMLEDVDDGRGVPDIDGRVSFGTALDGVTLLVLDDDGQRVTTPHTLGELYFAGPCLFHGYFDDPEQTAKRLVADPTGDTSLTMYRTGDLVFFDDAGHFYFHSRVDNQVKVQGNRVELEEIDIHLVAHPDVLEAAAVYEPSPRPCVVAYVVLDPASQVSAEPSARNSLSAQIIGRCGEALPRYMLPSRCEFLPQLPRNPSGKVDRRALAALSHAATEQAS